MRTAAIIATPVRRFLLWLDERGIPSLSAVTAQDLGAYLDQVLVDAQDLDRQADLLNEVRRLWSYRDRLLPLDQLPAAPPWDGQDNGSLLGARRVAEENRTPRIPEACMDLLLVWSLRMIDDWSGDIISAYRQWRYLSLRGVDSKRLGRRPPSVDTAQRVLDAQQLVAQWQTDGMPLPGRVQPDGTISIHWHHIGRCLDAGTKRYAAPVREVFEQSGLPIADHAPLVRLQGRLDSEPWLPRAIAFDEAYGYARLLMSACMVVISYLSGMRPGEVLGLQRGCLQRDATTGLLLVHGRAFKGASDEWGEKVPEGAERDAPWVVVEPVARALDVLEQLHDETTLFPTTLAVGRGRESRRGRTLTLSRASAELRTYYEWTRQYAQDRGRPDVPPVDTGGPLYLRRFRRTLAWHIVRRPRGLVAAALQYGHVHTSITMGYAGSASAGYQDDHAFEAMLARLDQVQTSIARVREGEGVSGPAAQRYIDRLGRADAQFAGVVITSGKQAQQLLRNPDLQIYEGSGMTCVFGPGALCVESAHRDEPESPDLGNCRPGCQNLACTDTDATVLRERRDDLQRRVVIDLEPPYVRQRLAHEVERLDTLITAHGINVSREPEEEPA